MPPKLSRKVKGKCKSKPPASAPAGIVITTGNKERPSTGSSSVPKFPLTGDLPRLFCARHSPHPTQVTHIRGLHNKPVCMVYNTEPDEALPLLSSRSGTMPVFSVNSVNPMKVPVDTIAGLKYFTNLKNYSFREKAIPYIGLVPNTKDWRQQLRTLTETAIQPLLEQGNNEHINGNPTTPRPGQVQHPASWQRPATRSSTAPCISRDGIKTPRTPYKERPLEHISSGPDLETYIFGMLCGLLQTEDVHAAQSWLACASEREKALVLSIIQSVLLNRQTYYNFRPDNQPTDAQIAVQSETKLSPENNRLPPIPENEDAGIIGDSDKVDRLLVHRDQNSLDHPAQSHIAADELKELIRPPTSSLFRPISTEKSQTAKGDLPPLQKCGLPTGNMVSRSSQVSRSTSFIGSEERNVWMPRRSTVK